MRENKMNSNISELINLYNATSKHSNYQVMPSFISEIIPTKELKIHSRYEKERLQYILKNVDVKNKNFCDIGANSGFFSFELINNGANHSTIYEGNDVHAKFVEQAAQYIGMSDRFTVNNQYYEFDNCESKYDMILLLNVLHHIGDDYGKAEDICEAKKSMIDSINKLSKVTRILVLQIGFNWKGNRNICLFEEGTKKEMISWLEKGISDFWNIKMIGVAQKNGNNIEYVDLDENNIERVDELGEFLNRPLFILESKMNL